MGKHLKVDADFFESEQIVWLESRVFGMEYVNVYLKLETMRLKKEHNMFENDAHYLAQQMRMQPLIVEMALQAMEQIGLVDDAGGGLLKLNSPLEVLTD